MMKKSLIALGFAFTLAACGPSQTPPPADQSAAQQPPPAAAPAPAPAAAPAPAPAAPTNDAEAARLRAEEHKLHREEAQLQQSQAAAAQAAAMPPPPPPCGDCGVIAAITPVHQQGQAGLLGAAAGGAAGGLVGNQFGHGSGKTVMTIAGVLGGAVAGAEVQKAATSSTVFQVAVNMEAGGQRVVTLKNAEGLAVGVRVHLDGNSIQPY